MKFQNGETVVKNNRLPNKKQYHRGRERSQLEVMLVLALQASLVKSALPHLKGHQVNLKQSEEQFCPLQVFVQIEQPSPIGPLNIAEAEQMPYKEQSKQMRRFKLNADSGPLLATVRDIKTGMIVPDRCLEEATLAWKLDSYDGPSKCDLMNQMKLDSENAPSMLIFKPKMVPQTEQCEDGLYELKIKAEQRKTGASADIKVMIEVDNTTSLSSMPKDGQESLLHRTNEFKLDQQYQKSLREPKNQSKELIEAKNQSQRREQVGQKGGISDKLLVKNPVVHQEKVGEKGLKRKLQTFGCNTPDDGYRQVTIKSLDPIDPCPSARPTCITDQTFFANCHVYQNGIYVHPLQTLGWRMQEYVTVEYQVGTTTIKLPYAKQQLPYTGVLEQGSIPLQRQQFSHSHSLIESDPSCISLEWRIINSPLLLYGYFDDPSNPSMFIVPDQGGNLTFPTDSKVNVGLFANGIHISEGDFELNLDIQAGNAHPLCTLSSDTPLNQIYEMNSSIQIQPIKLTIYQGESSCSIPTSPKCNQSQHRNLIDLCLQYDLIYNGLADLFPSLVFRPFDKGELGIISQDEALTFVLEFEFFLQNSLPFIREYTIHLYPENANPIQAPEEITIDYLIGQGEVTLDLPTFTTAWSSIQQVSLVSYDQSVVQYDQNGAIIIETNDVALADSISTLVFKAVLDNDPSMTATTKVHINFKGETKLTQFVKKMPDPFFQNIGGKFKEPFLINPDIGDANEIVEFDLGSLIVPNVIGQTQVTVKEDGKASFIQLVKVGDLYKLTVDKSNALSGNFKKTVVISGGSNGSSINEQQIITIPVLVIKDEIVKDKNDDENKDDGQQELISPQQDVSDNEIKEIETQSTIKYEILTEEERDINLEIKKPKLKQNKVSLSGNFEIQFSNQRLKEGLIEFSNKVAQTIEIPPIYGTVSNDWSVQGLSMWIEPSEMSDPERLKFLYKSQEFSNEFLSIQLIFEHPNEVSLISYDQDYLVIEFEWFRDKEGELITDYHTIKTPLPNQCDVTSTAYQVMEKSGNTVVVAAGVTAASSFTLTMLMASSLQQLLSDVKNLQMTSHLALLSVFVPAFALGFFDKIFQALTFDVYDPVEFTKKIFGISQAEVDGAELDDNLAQLGYENGYMPVNFGSLLYIIFFWIVITILLVVLQYFFCTYKCRNWAQGQVQGIFFNSVLTWIDSCFLLIVMTATINIKLVAEGKLDINSCFIFSIVGLLVCLAEIICVALYFGVYYTTLNEERRINRCGSIYEGLNFVVRGGKALTYPLLYQLRFALLVFTILFLEDKIVPQMLSVTLSTIYLVFIIGTVKPFKELSQNYNEIASESIVIFTADLLFCASDPQTTADRKEEIGYAIVGIVGLSIGITVIKVNLNNLRNLWLYLKRCKNRSQANKQSQKVKIGPKKAIIDEISSQLSIEQKDHQPNQPNQSKIAPTILQLQQIQKQPDAAEADQDQQSSESSSSSQIEEEKGNQATQQVAQLQSQKNLLLLDDIAEEESFEEVDQEIKRVTFKDVEEQKKQLNESEPDQYTKELKDEMQRIDKNVQKVIQNYQKQVVAQTTSYLLKPAAAATPSAYEFHRAGSLVDEKIRQRNQNARERDRLKTLAIHQEEDELKQQHMPIHQEEEKVMQSEQIKQTKPNQQAYQDPWKDLQEIMQKAIKEQESILEGNKPDSMTNFNNTQE